MAMTLNSPAFKQNGHMPSKYTCEGKDVSPPLAWDGIPNGTRSLVLMIDDPDALDPKAPKMVWVHWVVYNMPPDTRRLPENAGQAGLPQAPCLGSMTSKRRNTAAPVRRLVVTVISVSSMRWIRRSTKERDKVSGRASDAGPCAGQRRAQRHVSKR